jgi:hypothetical protein
MKQNTDTPPRPVDDSGKGRQSVQASICLTAAIGIITAGLLVFTGLYKFLPTIFDYLTNNFLPLAGISISYIAFVTVIWWTSKHKILRTTLLHGGVWTTIVMMYYYLCIKGNYEGQPYVNILGPALLEIGVLVLATCLANHAGNPNKIRKFVDVFFSSHLALAILLSVTAAFFRAGENIDRALASQAFLTMHKGETHRASEVFKYRGLKFDCSLKDAVSKCDYITLSR